MDTLGNVQAWLGDMVDWLDSLRKRLFAILLGAAVAVLVFAWHLVKGTPIPWSLEVAIVLFAFGFAAFEVWREERRVVADRQTEIATLRNERDDLVVSLRDAEDLPDLHGNVAKAAIELHPKFNHVHLTVFLEITNSGGPTAVRDYRIIVKRSDGREVEGALELALNGTYKVHYPDGSVEEYGLSSLISNVQRRLEKGDEIAGILRAQFPIDVLNEDHGLGLDQIFVRFRDYQRRYYETAPPKGWRTGQHPGYIPGFEIPKAYVPPRLAKEQAPSGRPLRPGEKLE